MKSERKLAANRANAQKSTGPKTPAGKAKVAQNGIKHGLCGQFRVLDEIESQEKFDAFRNQLLEDEQPVGQAEIELVVKMAEHTWMAKRALRMQNNCFVPKTPEQVQSDEIPVGVDANLEHCLRYHAAHDRAYQRASAELLKRKKEQRVAEFGFASQQRAERQAERRQAEEKRRERRHEQREERHQIALAIAKTRLEQLEVKTMQAAHGVAKLLDGLLPPGINQFAARNGVSDPERSDECPRSMTVGV